MSASSTQARKSGARSVVHVVLKYKPIVVLPPSPSQSFPRRQECKLPHLCIPAGKTAAREAFTVPTSLLLIYSRLTEHDTTTLAHALETHIEETQNFGNNWRILVQTHYVRYSALLHSSCTRVHPSQSRQPTDCTRGCMKVINISGAVWHHVSGSAR